MVPASGADPEQEVLSVHSEALTVSRRQVEESVVRVAILTQDHEQIVDEVLSREHVEIERVPIGRQLEAMPPVREEGNTTILPVVEEVVVVERRLILKEEIRVTRVRSEEHHRESVMLRNQDVVITRTEPGPNAVENTLLPLGTRQSTIVTERPK